MMPLLMDDVVGMGVAVLAGLAVGIEREWSGHAPGGSDARFAGTRAFVLLGLIAGVAGWLFERGQGTPGTIVLVAAAAIVVAAYVVVSRGGGEAIDGTTELAGLAVLTLGVAAGLGYHTLAGGGTALVVLALAEKHTIANAIRRVDAGELRAAALFAALALIVLPALPAGPFDLGPLGSLRPRALWAVVLLFSALNFAGHIARRAAGARGYVLAGMLGGLVSSTAVALTFARKSRQRPGFAGALGAGVAGACTVLMPRILVVTTVLHPLLAVRLLPFLAPGLVAGALLVARDFRRHPQRDGADASSQGSPLGLWNAARMTAAFQAVLILIHVIDTRIGSAGVLASAGVLGLTDMDALTLAMARLGRDAGALPVAARAIAIGVLANTAMKATLAAVFGEPQFRRAALRGLAAIGGVTAAALALFW